VELKVRGLETTVLDCLKRSPPQRGYVVSSFLPDVLHNLRTLDPQMPLGLIAETQAQLSIWQNMRVEFLMPHHTLIDVNVTQAMQRAGRKVLVWTVNGRERMLHALALGVDGIISDETDVLGQMKAQG
jgi:glycerophosphoryl diester phosphodiesterase